MINDGRPSQKKQRSNHNFREKCENVRGLHLAPPAASNGQITLINCVLEDYGLHAAKYGGVTPTVRLCARRKQMLFLSFFHCPLCLSRDY